ncbi:transposase-like protein [Bradyrhizobium sp. I1.7.5]
MPLRSMGSFPAHATIMLGTQTVNVLNKVAVSVQATMKKDFARSIGREPSVRRSGDRRLRREALRQVWPGGRSNAWSRIATHCWPSRIFLPNIGDHLRTTNPIEHVFATGRYRTVRTKGSLSPTTARPMVFKLVITTSRTWRRLKGTNLLPNVVAIVGFNDGIEIEPFSHCDECATVSQIVHAFR